MTKAEESAYIQGQEMLANRIIQTVLPNLTDGALGPAQVQLHLSETRSALCRLYDYLGFKEHWDDGLHLVDLVTRLEKLLPEGGGE